MGYLNSRLDAEVEEFQRKHDPDGKIRKKVREERIQRIQEEATKSSIKFYITVAIIITIVVLISLFAN